MKIEIKPDGVWYHGSNVFFAELKAGSTITQWRELAEAFSHKPGALGYDDDGLNSHNGTEKGYLYIIDEWIDIQKDIYQHPGTTMDQNAGFITKRPLKVKMIRECEAAGAHKASQLLFDLDGTLTDPKEGICKSVQYALHALGIEEPDLDKLEPFIGPPLADSFMEFYGLSKERTKQAIVKYRERFSVRGWAENKVYEGIPDMLKSLKEAGYILAVASSKPTVFVERILTHFGLRDAFSVVAGSELDGRRTGKEEVIEETLRQLSGQKDAGKYVEEVSEQSDAEKRQDAAKRKCDAGENRRDTEGNSTEPGGGSCRRGEVIMIGDRKFDIEGAHAHGMRCVGVAYGYAQSDELEQAGADFIVDSPAELLQLLLRLRTAEESGDMAVCRREGCALKRAGGNVGAEKTAGEGCAPEKDSGDERRYIHE